MKLYGILGLFLISLFTMLAACSDDSREEAEQPGGFDETAGHTEELPIFYIVNSKEEGYNPYLITNCWDADEKECQLTPQKPHDYLLGTPTMSVKSKESVIFTLAANSTSFPEELRSIDKVDIELIQYFKGEETNVEVERNSFTPPDVPGRYFYSIVLKWTGEIKGEANYAFAIVVNA